MDKLNAKTLGDAIGMPDEQDKVFIRRLILEFDKNNPGVLQYTIESARQDQRENSTAFQDITAFGEVDKASHRRHIFELPEGLAHEIERFYPTMFREKKHFDWFKKHFRELVLPDHT